MPSDLGAPIDPSVSGIAATHVIGTPLYLSPEAITSPGKIDSRSDLYSLGAVGYLLLTGTPPFAGANVVEVCSHHVLTQPTPPSERLGRPIPRDLEVLILKCLAKSPDQRPTDASALEQALRECESADQWTKDRALRWWRERGAALRSVRPSAPVSRASVERCR